MERFEEVDLKAVKRISVAERPSKVHADRLRDAPEEPGSFEAFWDALPAFLGAADLRLLAQRLVSAASEGRRRIWLSGAHVIKVGLGPYLIRLMEKGFIDSLAVNGAFAIHDLELCLWGKTSEDVAGGLADGTFGMAKETAIALSEAARTAVAEGIGYGQAVGAYLAAKRAGWQAEPVLGRAFQLGVPVTIHVAVGTDVVHQHPEFNGAWVGESSARDFRILSQRLVELQGGVVVNLGSAVVLPEVFLKALSVARNLGGGRGPFTTAALDFVRQYRPQENVVDRPHTGQQGGRGIYLLGHHEILIPLLLQGCLLEMERAAAR